MFDWNDLRLLLAVARRGSFLQAGELLGLATSTISRRISRLESSLGEPVVERAVDGARMTARGRMLVDLAEHHRLPIERLRLPRAHRG